MRKITLAFMALTIVFLTTSCGRHTENKPVTVSKTVTITADTTINMVNKTAITAPRWSCSGEKQKVPKFLGMDSTVTPVNIRLTRTQNVDFECAAASASSGTSNGGSAGSSDWSDFWKILAGLVALAIIIFLLAKYWPKGNNSSSKKGNDMNNSAANPAILAGLNETINRLKGIDGKGKGSIKYNHPTEGFEVVTGKPKAKGDVIILNTGSGNVYNGDNMTLIASGNTTPTPVRLIVVPKKDEPKKEEPAAPAATSSSSPV